MFLVISFLLAVLSHRFLSRVGVSHAGYFCADGDRGVGCGCCAIEVPREIPRGAASGSRACIATGVGQKMFILFNNTMAKATLVPETAFPIAFPNVTGRVCFLFCCVKVGADFLHFIYEERHVFHSIPLSLSHGPTGSLSLAHRP